MWLPMFYDLRLAEILTGVTSIAIPSIIITRETRQSHTLPVNFLLLNYYSWITITDPSGLPDERL
jgi:hypothetical protein